jgi:alpha-1,2-mannosyltransferase
MGAAQRKTPGMDNPGAAPLLDRVRGLSPLSFAVLFAAFFSPYFLVAHLVTFFWNPPGSVSPDGVNLGGDFNAFYSAAILTLNGEAVNAYDHAAMGAAQQQVSDSPVKNFPWFYPPVMFAFVAPLAFLSYPAAFALWVLAPLVALVLVIRRYAGHALASVAILIFPGTLQSVLAGQNGVLSALIIAGGVLSLERRPVLAGAILGLLSYKPHVAAAVYAALLIGHYWRALGAAIAVALALVAASLVVLGPDPWLAFFRETEVARIFMENGKLRWTFMATPFAAARLAGLDVQVAYALQAAVSCGALVALFVVWRRNDIPLDARAAVLVTVIPLLSPYAFSYDLAIIGIALLWLLREGFETGFRHDELVVFAIAWVIALMGFLLALASDVLLTPVVLVALLAVLLRRMLRRADDDVAGRRDKAVPT